MRICLVALFVWGGMRADGGVENRNEAGESRAAGSGWCAGEERERRTALAEAEARYGADSGELVPRLFALSEILALQDQWDAADTVALRGIAIRERALNPVQGNLTNLLHDLSVAIAHRADLRLWQQKPEEALRLYQRAYKLCHKLLPVEHPDRIHPLTGTMICLAARCQLEDALPLLQQAEQLRRRATGGRAGDVAEVCDAMAFSLAAAQRHEEALDAARQSLEWRRRTLHPADPRIAYSLTRVASLLFETGKRDEVPALLREALEIRQAAFGSHHPKVAASWDNLAAFYRDTGDADRAEECAARAAALSAP